ncbi:MAG: hypothetical protein E7356_00425 [Clostridiales bacterium]|nr:hypothetical protein [Clostridiales bacterium]
MKLLDFINEKTNNAYKDYKLVSVIFDETKIEATFKFLYKDELGDNAKDELTKLIRDYLAEDIAIVVKCKKAYVDSDLVRDVIFNFVVRNYSSLEVNFSKKDINVEIDNSIVVNMKCTEFQREHILSNSIDREIIDYANSFFFEDFVLNLVVDENSKKLKIEDEVVPVINIDLSSDAGEQYKYHKVGQIEQFVGEVKGYPIHIACIKGVMENIEIAGTMKFLNEKSFESKRKDKEGNAVIRRYFSFVVQGKTGRMNCVYFPNKADISKAEVLMEAINNGEEKNVIVAGDVEEFGGRVNFKVKSIAFAEVLVEEEKVESVAIIKEPNAEYITIKPEKHVDVFQDNLFAEKQEIGQYLLDHDVVVFDFETTGIEASRCEIIEIGAVKVSGGRITETFETLIKPSTSIPDEITGITGINDEMVANAPNIKQVLPDFYKFCYGCTIMAYNIDFDYKFLSIAGQKMGYVFDNEQIDVLYLSRMFIPGLKKFNLTSACKALGISLENAHRAVHDAMATAEVVIKLSPNIT